MDEVIINGVSYVPKEEPAQPKRPRVGYIYEWLGGASAHPSNLERVKAVELTDDVRQALAAAGIEIGEE